MNNTMIGIAEKVALNSQENKIPTETSSNMGVSDSLLRMILGAIILFSMYLGHIGTIGWFGAVPLAMGFVSWCPFYAIFGLSTCKTKAKTDDPLGSAPEEHAPLDDKADD